MEKGAGQSTQRVLPWHGDGLEYLQGTAEGMEMVMCDWPGFMKEGGHVWLTTGSLLKIKWVPSFLEILQKRFSKWFSLIRI
jgi:hypothetical protein